MQDQKGLVAEEEALVGLEVSDGGDDGLAAEAAAGEGEDGFA